MDQFSSFLDTPKSQNESAPTTSKKRVLNNTEPLSTIYQFNDYINYINSTNQTSNSVYEWRYDLFYDNYTGP